MAVCSIYYIVRILSEDENVKARRITKETTAGFERYLHQEEKSRGTVDKYVRDVKAFAVWLAGEQVSREKAADWKEHLLNEGRAPVTVNSMIAAVNTFFGFMGWDDCRVKSLRLQKRFFRENERELTKPEYERLLKAAYDQGKERLGLLMETMCATGIRVSEVRYITTEAIKKGRAEISMKGKHRVILIPDKLCRKLRKYVVRTKRGDGEIFTGRSGQSLDRRQIWAEMKALCKIAGIAAEKVFPHNLRHLFARSFYQVFQNIVSLADVLGHSSIETTRIYLISTEEEHIKKIARLDLVL